jgi:lysophospholipase L1-like esterase
LGIEFSLEKAAMQKYRKYGVSGTRLLDEVIPNQYETAKMAGPIKTVVMTGGGNDILQDVGILFSGACNDDQFDTDPAGACKKQIDMVAARLVKLWAEMAADGVMDVVVVGYTNKASLTGPLTKSNMYSNVKIPPLCAAVPAPLRCHSIDTDKEVPDLNLMGDGIHPDAAGFDKIAAAVWKRMQEQGIRR